MKQYQATDKFLKQAKKKIRTEFNFLSVLSFDELNAITVKKKTAEMFSRLLQFNEDGYAEIVRSAREYALSLLSDEEKKKVDKLDDEEYVEYVLSNYNPVTGYLYESEAERKRLRLAEQILTAKEYLDRESLNKGLNRTANLWYTQTMQYAIDMEDNTCLDTWKEAGIKKVQWISEHDNKTCGTCSERDCQVYDIDKVPTKTHYNCRCRLIPYSD